MELAVGGAVFLALIVVLTVVLGRRRSTGKQGEAELNVTATAIAEANRLRNNSSHGI